MPGWPLMSTTPLSCGTPLGFTGSVGPLLSHRMSSGLAATKSPLLNNGSGMGVPGGVTVTVVGPAAMW